MEDNNVTMEQFLLVKYKFQRNQLVQAVAFYLQDPTEANRLELTATMGDILTDAQLEQPDPWDD